MMSDERQHLEGWNQIGLGGVLVFRQTKRLRSSRSREVMLGLEKRPACEHAASSGTT